MFALRYCLKILNVTSKLHTFVVIFLGPKYDILSYCQCSLLIKNGIYMEYYTEKPAWITTALISEMRCRVMEWEHKDCWTHWGEMGPIQRDICDGRASFNNPKDKTIRPLHSSPTSQPGSHSEAEPQNREKSHVESGAQQKNEC